MTSCFQLRQTIIKNAVCKKKKKKKNAVCFNGTFLKAYNVHFCECYLLEGHRTGTLIYKK